MANGRRGAETERECVLELKRRGYAATRSAASKGFYDVIGIRGDSILLIQCKRTKSKSRAFMKKDMDLLHASPRPDWPGARRQMWAWIDRIGWRVIDIDRPQEGEKS